MPIGPPHAPSLMQQIELIRDEVGKLPLNDFVSDLTYPNRMQQEALLKRAMGDLQHAVWAIEEYNGGRQLGAISHPTTNVIK